MYREAIVGPKTPLQNHRFNLIGSGLSYSFLGLIFHFADQTNRQSHLPALLRFLLIGGATFLVGIASLKNRFAARYAKRVHIAAMVFCSANFADYAAVHELTAPHFAVALMGPFIAAASMAVYNRQSVIVIYTWLSYGLNIVAALYHGTGTSVYYTLNLLTVLAILPVLTNIVRASKAAKDHRVRTIEAALRRQGSAPRVGLGGRPRF